MPSRAQAIIILTADSIWIPHTPHPIEMHHSYRYFPALCSTPAIRGNATGNDNFLSKHLTYFTGVGSLLKASR
ncbi:hypothetical protein K9N68_08580 [Kovacikia minuta CCNUW1]|uniref:hypothetical protein n=1 Tax=Kovacikia minuta TaxID=2931930 RepID=UPI001CC91714|nr:hypothetical protein [Kovacikia minuta]UBF27936.1 hypothetical protein K9N68_08580 [Kovacikia minuta CCNUW1]